MGDERIMCKSCASASFGTPKLQCDRARRLNQGWKQSHTSSEGSCGIGTPLPEEALPDQRSVLKRKNVLEYTKVHLYHILAQNALEETMGSDLKQNSVRARSYVNTAPTK